MQNANRKPCPFCAAEIPRTFIVCNHCGRELHSLRLARSKAQPKVELYEIVADGQEFGIALHGKIRLHGLELEKARQIVAILNSGIGLKQAG